MMSGKKHGCYRTAEYKIWLAMKGRCQNFRNKQYPAYGGRGIDVCARWEAFENFISDMGVRPSPSLSIERIDNDRGYSPDNCRWATRTEQNNNKRDNLLVQYRGHTMTFAQAYRASNSPCDITNAFKRYKRGWLIEVALETPPQKTWSVQSRRRAA